jgi:hypothetical protein
MTVGPDYVRAHPAALGPPGDDDARHPSAEPDREPVARSAERRGQGDELVQRAVWRGGRHDMVEQTVVLVVVEDESRRLPQLAVGGDGVELRCDPGRTVVRRVVGVLPEGRRGAEPADGRKVAGQAVVLERAGGRVRDGALVKDRVRGGVREVREIRQDVHVAVVLVVELPGNPRIGEGLRISRPGKPPDRPGSLQAGAAVLAVGVDAAGHPHEPVGGGGAQHRTVIVVEDGEALSQAPAEGDAWRS